VLSLVLLASHPSSAQLPLKVRTVREIFVEGECSAPDMSSPPSKLKARVGFGVFGAVHAGVKLGVLDAEMDREEPGVVEDPADRDFRNTLKPRAVLGEGGGRPVSMSMHDVSSLRPCTLAAMETIFSAARSQASLPAMHNGTFLAMTRGRMASQTPSDATQTAQPPSGIVTTVEDGSGDT